MIKLATALELQGLMCKVLGLDPMRTGNVKIEADPSRLVVVTVRIYPTTEQLQEIVKAIAANAPGVQVDVLT